MDLNKLAEKLEAYGAIGVKAAVAKMRAAEGMGEGEDFSAYPGANPVEQAMACIKANGGASLSYDDLHRRACAMVERASMSGPHIVTLGRTGSSSPSFVIERTGRPGYRPL